MDKHIRFCPIASGSSGNCIYVGTKHTHILIDAGISGKRIQEGLATLQIAGGDIDALFITHEHRDHIAGAGILSRRFHIPIYATFGTWQAMDQEIGFVAPENVRYVYPGEGCVLNDMRILPFEIAHDAAEPVGYSVFSDQYKVSVATDMGHVTTTVRENISGSDILLLESNHDVEMLKNGSYPRALKQRILGDRGHLSNETAGELLSEIYSERLKYVYLGHLSEENNHPQIAFETVERILNRSNIEVGTYLKMDLAARYSPSRPVEL